MSAEIDGIVVEHVERLPMWAVYLDGYAYHAKEPNMRFQSDKDKRDGIRASQSHLLYSWTLTWNDMQLFEKGEDDSLGMNNVTRLMEFLKRPLVGNMTETALGCIMDAEGFMSHGGALYHGEISVDESAYDTLTEDSSDEEVAKALAGSVTYDWHLQPASLSIDEDEWIGFWRRYNLLQFFPQDNGKDGADVVPAEETVIDRSEIKMYYPGLEDIVDQLLDNGIRFSYDGEVDLLNEEGIVVATAELLLHDQRVAINPLPESTEVFHSLGYSTMTSDEFNVASIIK